MTHPADPSHLLMEACDVVEMIADGVGAPADCLKRGVVPLREGRRIGRMLGALEALVRRILVIMAFALAPTANHRQPATKQQIASRPGGPSPDARPATFGPFRFRMLTPQIHPLHGGPPLRFINDGMALGRLSKPSQGARELFMETTRLASRYAAVLRVILDPEPFAKRLAAKLRRLERPHDHVELSRNAAHLDIDPALWTRGVRKSRDRLWIERHPCRRAHIAASAHCVALAEEFWTLKLPYLAGG